MRLFKKKKFIKPVSEIELIDYREDIRFLNYLNMLKSSTSQEVIERKLIDSLEYLFIRLNIIALYSSSPVTTYIKEIKQKVKRIIMED
ncbi:MAG: hypothetical protein ACTSVV_14465 [Promethearchaeota archaeon]